MKKVLITGISGQDGSYLSEMLLNKNYEVHGIIRYGTNSNINNIKNINHILKDIHLHYGDISDPLNIKNIIQKVNPDEVYNLAAQSQVRVSFDQPLYTSTVDAIGVLNILESIRQFNPNIKMYQASTSEMFGKIKEYPQNEKTPFHPRSPYGCSKVYGYWQSVNYREAYNMFICNGILFNHESPRRGETFVTRKITRAATRIKEGLQNELQLGNLDAKRDWGFAGDYVEAMWLMMQHEQPDDYVIATGSTYTVKDFVEKTFAYLNLEWTDFVKYDKSEIRPSEVDLLIGDASKAKNILKWQPKVNFENLIHMMVEADLEIAKKEKKGIKIQ